MNIFGCFSILAPHETFFLFLSSSSFFFWLFTEVRGMLWLSLFGFCATLPVFPALKWFCGKRERETGGGKTAIPATNKQSHDFVVCFCFFLLLFFFFLSFFPLLSLCLPPLFFLSSLVFFSLCAASLADKLHSSSLSFVLKVAFLFASFCFLFFSPSHPHHV